LITNAPTLLVVQHVDREGPDLIAEIAMEQGMAIQTIRPDQGEPLPNPTSTQNTIALLLGGPMSVGERHQDSLAWMQRELDWLTVWHQHNKPVLGICLGAQFLAVAAGGDVQPLQVGLPSQPLKEVGYGAIHWLMKPSSEPLLMGLQPSELVLHWHGDRIKLPPTATLLGSSLQCPEQVFRIANHAIGLQCHMELTTRNLEQWIREDHNYIVSAMGPDGPERLRQDGERFGDLLERQGRRFISNALAFLTTQ
jgi:GMP synthase-like glutamine amidotransferase